MYPTDRRYSKDHEWVRVDGESIVVGITEFAQNELGDIVYVELPEKGLEVKAGDVLGTIESVKAVSEIYAPVSGAVLDSNETLNDRPETANTDPHAGGWYCRMRPADPAELEALLDAAAYEEIVAG